MGARVMAEASEWRLDRSVQENENPDLWDRVAFCPTRLSGHAVFSEGAWAVIEVKFKRVEGNHDLPLPAYATSGAAGMDLRAFLPDGPVTFEHGQLRLISTGFHVELPPGVEMQVRPRSGLSLRHGLMIPNSPGTVDEDFRGVLMVGFYSIGTEPYTIRHGDRIAQGVIADVRRCAAVEVDQLSETERGAGGFGSTGVR